MSTRTSLTSAALLVIALASTPSFAHSNTAYSKSSPWDLKKFTSLVTFGDSYTDDSRLSYIGSHNGSLPPVGYDNPANYASASGGRPWPQYVKQYTNNTLHLYNYAVSGAVCSNNITPRIYFGDVLFPAVEQYEIGAFTSDSKYYNVTTGEKFMTNPWNETVYSIWIGTNDLGNNALLTDTQRPGTNIVNYTDCVYSQLKRIYDQGGRYFILQNVAPLNLAPLYATAAAGGVSGPNRYWPGKPDNITEISYRMMEQVVTVNRIYDFQTPFVTRVSEEMKEARFAVMDMHGLISDIYYNPSLYLNGTAPLNVQSYDNKCNATGAACVRSSSPDSFLWYDALHPSEQTDRVIAREFLEVVKGGSRWARYW